MRFLVVEDDYGSRRLLQTLLKNHGEVDSVVDGQEAIEAFQLAWEDNAPYNGIFLDIMMPRMDGQEALKQIRAMEKTMGIAPQHEAKIVMTTALEDPRNVIEAFNKGGASAYLVKPIDKNKLMEELHKLGLG